MRILFFHRVIDPTNTIHVRENKYLTVLFTFLLRFCPFGKL